jgi:hypothetical protein
MTEQATPDDQATPEQMEQVRTLAADTGEEVPETMRTSEASQRIVELRANS